MAGYHLSYAASPVNLTSHFSCRCRAKLKLEFRWFMELGGTWNVSLKLDDKTSFYLESD